MSEYKFFFLDETGHVYRSEDRKFRGDLEALEAAQKLRSKDTIEVWQLGREVARVKPGDGNATPSDRVSG
ncbi:MAG TPA: hypothetical protein VMF58_11550 [Rhizomicrobium sp.]|nr:hypothetical protein [Rhizomicrobium sp.]